MIPAWKLDLLKEDKEFVAFMNRIALREYEQMRANEAHVAKCEAAFAALPEGTICSVVVNKPPSFD